MASLHTDDLDMANFYNDMDELSTYLNRLRSFFQNLINDLQDQMPTLQPTIVRECTQAGEVNHDLKYQSVK